ncbi:hypothetical protein [Novosphingobium sp.]|uniref:hypothetical protein n=1 Tax=Novosphingobium sp. TaxID=1874826 RepID=UPI0022BB276A|nr:hypothetical protein [Novosphingobium sp.]MCZ8018650.1 hypothetical protein [Novosphingobium sp.]MCZ8034655.1 hypothetical protein [Novosphingobium sp.]MCZ8052790.1 hypothetical protein [Novosphingobium sp.]MCZ8060548.1 hypothetical protein [Novosphingobium sp.]MCZ8230574.1 hypothetical protein [Novosphingobium sp.]
MRETGRQRRHHGKPGTTMRPRFHPDTAAWKTGAGEGIRTLDPNLGKIRVDAILSLDQIVIFPSDNPNTIRRLPRYAICSPVSFKFFMQNAQLH